LAGNRPTLEEAYRRYFPLIREKCRRMLEDAEEASDVAQETFIRFWRDGSHLTDAHHITAWMYRTGTRLAVDRIRQRKPRLAFQSAALVQTPSAQSPEAVELRRLFVQIAPKVPRQELEVAILRRADGLGQLEIAELTSLSERTVRRLLSRFDERVAALLKEPS
jgi:RNA polymerase sigma-70 factor (ECF subfamily)